MLEDVVKKPNEYEAIDSKANDELLKVTDYQTFHHFMSNYYDEK